MVIIPTYCEINGALITYKQMGQINHKEHQQDSPTNTTSIRNNQCFRYQLANDMHKSQKRSTQHSQVKGYLHLDTAFILQWCFKRIMSFHISKKKTTHSPCMVFFWFAPIMSIIVNPKQKMTTLTKEETKHGNNFNVL